MKQSQQNPAPESRSPALERRYIHNRNLCLLLAALIIAGGLLAAFSPDRDFSEQENRKLAQRPVLTRAALADGSYFADLTDWYNDQFPYRDTWLSIKLRLETLRGSREAGGVYLGQDGYLLEPPEAPSPALDVTLQAIRNFAANHSELPMRMLLVPCAAAAMPELLPEYAPVRDQAADIAAVEQALAGSVTFLHPQFTPSPEGAIYYKTDHHWTTLGAWQAFQTTAADMELDPAAASWIAYPVSDSFRGTLSSRSGSRDQTDSIAVYAPLEEQPYYVFYPDTQIKTATLYAREKLDTKDQYAVFLDGNHPLAEIRTTTLNDRRLLVFKDSYANCFLPFLVPYYESIVVVDPRYCFSSAEALLAEYNITEVLYLYSANLFLTDTSLASLLSAQ